MSNVPSQILAQSGYQELYNLERSPVMQIEATNGIRGDSVKVIVGPTSSATEVDSNFVLQTGIDPESKVSLLSQRHAKHRSGQGISCRMSALWEGSAADSIQIAGLFNDSQGYVFCYIGTEFGIARFYDGQSEVQFLQITTPAGGAENATVTVDGVAYTVPLTAGTVNHNAYEIAVSLSAQVPTYEFTSNQDQVTAVDDIARSAGAFAFTSATAVAVWTQASAGVFPTPDFVPMTSWKYPPDWAFDPSKGNEFQIRLFWGYGGAEYYIASPTTNQMVLVHKDTYLNINTKPTVEVPTFRCGWALTNDGNTTPLTMRGSEAAIFVDGKIQTDERSRGVSVRDVALNSTNPINLISIRNRSEYDKNVNRTTVYPQALTIAAEHNKPVVFYLQIGTTYTGDMEYSYVDEVNSCMEYSISQAIPNLDGRKLGEESSRSIAPYDVQIEKILQYLQPGEELSISAALDSGAGGNGDVTIQWLEDL